MRKNENSTNWVQLLRLPTRLKKTLQNKLYKAPLALQLTVAFWGVYIVAGVSTSIISEQYGVRMLLQSELNMLKAEGDLLKGLVDRWENQVLTVLEVFSEAGATPRDIMDQNQMSGLSKSIYGSDYGGILKIRVGPKITTTPVFHGQLDAGYISKVTGVRIGPLLKSRTDWLTPSGTSYKAFTSAYYSPTANKRFLFTALPLRNNKSELIKNPSVFIAFLLPVDAFLEATGLAQIDEILSGGVNTSAKGGDGDHKIPSLILAGSDGRMLLAFTNNGLPLDGKMFNNDTPIWKQIKQALSKRCATTAKAGEGICQQMVKLEGSNYLLNYSPDDVFDSGIGSISLLSTDPINDKIRGYLMSLIAIELVFAILGTVAIRQVSKKLAQPVEEASEALEQLSTGNFCIEFKTHPIGEIRKLHLDIRRTANKLKSLLENEKTTAISLKEIETAKAIQKNFLPAITSKACSADFAALCEPALSVGADWYDVIPIKGGTVYVVADVCDKGVGSALFMSVFRSLLRFFTTELLLSEPTNCTDDEAVLKQIMTRVNNYMADTHGDAAMFATVFLALHRPEQERLVVVNAGHEATILISKPGSQPQYVEASGPVIGVFAGAVYQSHSLPCPQGSWILMYSDGLPDASNIAGERFGHERIEATFLEAIDNTSSETLGASEVLNTVRASVARHSGDAAPFDDLTIMVVNTRMTSKQLPEI